MKRLGLGIICGILLWSNSAGAQERPVVQVLVDDIDQDTASCGINKSSLESIAALTLRNNGIQATNSLADSFMYVRAAALREAMGQRFVGCTLSLSVSLYQDIPHPSGAFRPRNRKLGLLQLCEKHSILSGPPATFSSRTHTYLEDIIKLCLGELVY